MKEKPMRKILSFTSILLLFLVFAPIVNNAQYIEKKTVSLELAKKIAAAAETEAAKNKWTVVVAIVDEGGSLIYLSRMDNTQSGSIEVAIQKAKCAINFKRATKVFEDQVAGGRNAILSLPGVLALEGGLPLVVNNQFVGAIGVSGAKSNEDGMVAKAGVDFFAGQ